MKTTIRMLITTTTITICLIATVYAQNPNSSYSIWGNSIRTQYDLAISSWNQGNYVAAYGALLFYYYANNMSGNFNQNPQFKREVEQALYDLGDYLGNGIRERDSLRNELRACQQACQDGSQTRGSSSVARQTPINRLPQGSPLF